MAQALAGGSGGRGPGSSLTNLPRDPGHSPRLLGLLHPVGKAEVGELASWTPLRPRKWVTHLVVTWGWAVGLCPDVFSHWGPRISSELPPPFVKSLFWGLFIDGLMH